MDLIFPIYIANRSAINLILVHIFISRINTLHSPTQQDVLIPIPDTTDTILLFAEMIKLRVLRWEDYCGSCEWPKGIRKVLIRGSQEGQVQRRMWNNRSKSQRKSEEIFKCYTEHWGWGKEPFTKTCKRTVEAKNVKETDFPKRNTALEILWF